MSRVTPSDELPPDLIEKIRHAWARGQRERVPELMRQAIGGAVRKPMAGRTGEAHGRRQAEAP